MCENNDQCNDHIEDTHKRDNDLGQSDDSLSPAKEAVSDQNSQYTAYDNRGSSLMVK